MDSHFGAETTRLNRRPTFSELCHDPLDQRFCVLGAGGVDPTRPTTLVGVAEQGELTDDEDFGRFTISQSHRERTVHHTGVVIEDPELPELLGEPVGLSIAV